MKKKEQLEKKSLGIGANVAKAEAKLEQVKKMIADLKIKKKNVDNEIKKIK